MAAPLEPIAMTGDVGASMEYRPTALSPEASVYWLKKSSEAYKGKKHFTTEWCVVLLTVSP